jgi:hypothetical protein
MKTILILTVAILLAANGARATECGDLRAQVARLTAALKAEEQLKRGAGGNEARSTLRTAQSKLDKACAPRKATITALPLGWVAVPQGNLSKATVDLSQGAGLVATTRAGAAAGIVFEEPVTIEIPPGTTLEVKPSPKPEHGELLLAVSTDAQLTMEEPDAGRGTWRIELKKPPVTLPLSKVKAGAHGKGESGLSQAACKALLAAAPLHGEGALPERGRAIFLGEWQYGWQAGLDLDPATLGEGVPPQAAPELDLALELSAPIPGVSDGKHLHVTLGANKRVRPDGFSFKLGHGCGDDDTACEEARYAVEVWWDRVFGVPFLRTPRAGTARVVGQVTDRLARPIAGQRMRLTVGDRRIVTTTDERGSFRFVSVPSGTGVVVPVGKDPGNPSKGDESRTVPVGLGETKVPVIYENKLWE